MARSLQEALSERFDVSRLPGSGILMLRIYTGDFTPPRQAHHNGAKSALPVHDCGKQLTSKATDELYGDGVRCFPKLADVKTDGVPAIMDSGWCLEDLQGPLPCRCISGPYFANKSVMSESCGFC